MSATLAKTDWDAIRRRLARATNSTQIAQLSPQAAKELMDERARALALVPPEPPSAAEVLEVIEFRLADEQFAVETRYVRAVVRPTEITPIPGAPSFLAGV